MKSLIKFILITSFIFLVIWAIYAVKNKSAANNSKANQSEVASTIQNEILKVKTTDNIRGEKNAAVTIIDYSDYQCPYCVSFDKTMDQVIEAYPTQVKWVYRHFPLPFHKAAKGAAIAAEAAGAQGKYWQFHDKLVANSQSDGGGLKEDDSIKYAGEIGLNIDQFKKDLTDKKFSDKVEQDIADGNNLKIQGTPAIYLIDKNGNVEKLAGAIPFGQLKQKIDQALTK